MGHHFFCTGYFKSAFNFNEIVTAAIYDIINLWELEFSSGGGKCYLVSQTTSIDEKRVLFPGWVPQYNHRRIYF